MWRAWLKAAQRCDEGQQRMLILVVVRELWGNDVAVYPAVAQYDRERHQQAKVLLDSLVHAEIVIKAMARGWVPPEVKYKGKGKRRAGQG